MSISSDEFHANPVAQLLALEVADLSADRVEFRWQVTPAVLQPGGVLHGGIHAWVHESAASLAAAAWFGNRGQVVGVNNNSDFLRAVRSGQLTSLALPVHRGRSQQLWLVQTHDPQGRLIAQGQVRLHNLWADPGAAKG